MTILNKEQIKEFDTLADAMIKFLNDNCHPHHNVVIDASGAELSEGVRAYRTEEHWRD